MNHRIDQELARQRKREEKAIRLIDDAYGAWRKGLVTVEVDKAALLAWMVSEGLAPESARRVIATGHYPDTLIVTVDCD